MADDLAYSPNGGHLAYKRRSGDLIYKFDGEFWAVIDISWGSDGRDLDICGYWTSRSSATVGWSQSGNSYRDGAYQSIWSSGDNTSVGGRERIYVRVSPWATSPRIYKVHFNYFGADEDHQSTTCTVRVKKDGVELVKGSQSCARNSGHRAETSDPCCTITFADNGTPLSLA